MTPTDRLPLSTDNAATEAVGFLRLPTAHRSPNNLSLQLNRFTGREHELREIKRMLHSTHLLTQTGPSGCGKPRLALRLACAHSAVGLLRVCTNLSILVIS
jgi:hypothetical protein